MILTIATTPSANGFKSAAASTARSSTPLTKAGHLLGEYDGTGALIEETLWLGDIPIATLRPNQETARNAD